MSMPEPTMHAIVSLPADVTHSQLFLANCHGRDLGMHVSEDGAAQRLFLVSADAVANGSIKGLKKALNGKGIISLALEDKRDAGSIKIDDAIITTARGVIAENGYRHAPKRPGKVTFGDHPCVPRWHLYA